MGGSARAAGAPRKRGASRAQNAAPRAPRYLGRTARSRALSFPPPHRFSPQLSGDAGLPGEPSEDDESRTASGATLLGPTDRRITLPKPQNLSSEALSSSGVFLLDNSLELLLWVGRATPPALLATLFNLPPGAEANGLDGIDPALLVPREPSSDDGNDVLSRLTNLLAALRHRRGAWLKLVVVRESDPATEGYFFRHLVEDRASFQGGSYSYQEYMAHISRQSQGVAGS